MHQITISKIISIVYESNEKLKLEMGWHKTDLWNNFDPS